MNSFVDIPKLGFGLMRLPKNGEIIDIEQVKTMVDAYMAAGYNYFDTALLYPGSEEATKKALVERFPRQSYKLATKINLINSGIKTHEEAVKAFDNQLERLGVDYIDFYLMHALRTDAGYEANLNMGFLDFLRQKKKENVIGHIGFSFHGNPTLLRRILDEQKDIEFVQIQLNYADWESTCAYSGELYKILSERNIPIIVMEPVKGGILANPIPEIAMELRKVIPNQSFASLALRFAASLDGVLTVLSGMSNMEQLQDNLNTFKNFTPINPAEKEAIIKANEILYNSNQIPCTRCEYCVKGCPKAINIPYILSLVNSIRRTPSDELTKRHYKNLPVGQKSSDCIECKKCENICPQGLGIIQLLKDSVAELYLP